MHQKKVHTNVVTSSERTTSNPCLVWLESWQLLPNIHVKWRCALLEKEALLQKTEMPWNYVTNWICTASYHVKGVFALICWMLKWWATNTWKGSMSASVIIHACRSHPLAVPGCLFPYIQSHAQDNIKHLFHAVWNNPAGSNIISLYTLEVAHSSCMISPKLVNWLKMVVHQLAVLCTKLWHLDTEQYYLASEICMNFKLESLWGSLEQ